jgi:Pvc16 N-terminal domain
MSNALAVAAVTAVLKNLLDNAMIDSPASTALITDPVTVKTLAPDRVRPAQNGQPETTQLNLFMYQVTTNPGWSNVDLPSMDSNGGPVTNPPLALDLHYLLTAYGQADFEAEVLLGYAMQVLHEKPVLTREAIRTALQPPSPVDGEELPEEMETLVASDLAEQVELVKLTPKPMNLEEMSKLWTAFQTNYRPSAAYQASVVLIESRRPARTALPVLTRGGLDPTTGRDRGVVSQPSLLPPFPTLQKVIPPNRQPAVRMGEVLAFEGHHLNGGTLTARFTHVRSSETLELPVLGATSTGFQVLMPSDPPPGPVEEESPRNPDNWRAGLYSVAAVVRRTGKSDRVTNELPVALAPKIRAISVTAANDTVKLEVTCSPKVWKAQRVSIVVGEQEVAAEGITEDKTDTLEFESSRFPTGQQWMRLRVDGVESILVNRTGPAPAFETSQQVTI